MTQIEYISKQLLMTSIGMNMVKFSNWLKYYAISSTKRTENINFPEDPLKTEVPGLSIKSDPELKSCVASSETNFVNDPLGISWTNNFIKEEPGHSLEADETVNIVVASTRGTSNSTRLILNSGENCGISLKETLAVPNELKINAEESKHSTIFDTQTHRLEEEEYEDDSLVTRLECSRRESEFHKLICNFCLWSFASKYRLIMHVFIHMDGLQPPPYVCKSCGEVFLSDTRLNKHLKFSDGDQASSAAHMDQFDFIYEHENLFLEGGRDSSIIENTEQQSSSQPKTQALPGTGTKRTHKCNVCGQLFTKLCNLKFHSLIHTGETPHKCNVCGKCFTASDKLKRHSIIHTGHGPFKCNDCGKCFAHTSDLRRHSLMHTGLRPHKCNICGGIFARISNLKEHSLIHTGQRPHKCNICGRFFSRTSVLRRHALIHTDQRPHKCNICGKSFALREYLKRHSLMHTDKRPHKCNICGKSFALKSDVGRHFVMHTGQRPHKCNVCGKSFARTSDLTKHSLIHTGQRPHKCNDCGKCFARTSDLRKHSFIHIGQTPHKCNICGKSSAHTDHLKKHCFIHTDQRPHK